MTLSESLPKEKTLTFSVLPETAEALAQTLDRKDPFSVAAFTVAALCVYPENKEESCAMLNCLKGPQLLSAYDKQFLRDRFADKDYVARSYFAGAVPSNRYTPEQPYRIRVELGAHSCDQEKEGYLTLFLTSGGADSPRPVKLRMKPSTGEWFLWEQSLLAGIRVPAAEDPWA